MPMLAAARIAFEMTSMPQHHVPKYKGDGFQYDLRTEILVFTPVLWDTKEYRWAL